MNFHTTAQASTGYFSPVDAPSYDQLLHCMRCGLCLPVCPTFSLYSLEKASPRGRLALMRATSEGRLELSDGFAEAMQLCLGCMACQTACPAGVPFGHLIEQARAQVESRQKGKRSRALQILREWLLENITMKPRQLELLLPLLWMYRKSGLQRLNLARYLSKPLGSWEKLLPAVSYHSARQVLGEFLPARGARRGQVGLLLGCLENTLLAKMTIATARLLAINGFDVIIPPEQGCCGALPGHIGDMDLARKQARRNIDIFEANQVEVVISDAGGCSAQLKEYGRLLADDLVYQERAKRFSEQARDAVEFLCENLPLQQGVQPLHLRVAYDDPCHLIHAQGISEQPRRLLKSIPGIELVELPEASWCCGSAGTYNLTHLGESEALLERKMFNLKRINPDVLATANTGCYLQLSAGVKKHGLHVEVASVVELLARAYRLP